MKKVYQLFDCDIFLADKIVAEKFFTDFLNGLNPSQVFILTDSNTRKYCLPLLLKAYPLLNKAVVLEIQAGESSKSQLAYEEIINALLDNHAERDSLLINLGGGVVCDLGGFIAGVYKRGIRFINMPTTLMAMADAAIGGKTAVNFDNIKNAIGLFNMPESIFVFTEFLNTLDARQINNGLAEIIKMAFLFGGPNFELIKRFVPADELPVTDILVESIQQKCRIVESDYLDKGARKLLNFGHTLGHALELIDHNSKGNLLHGEAIVQGMLFAAYLSRKKTGLSASSLILMKKILYFYFSKANSPKPSFNTVYTVLLNDKKNKLNTIQFVLLEKLGKSASMYECKDFEFKINWKNFTKPKRI